MKADDGDLWFGALEEFQAWWEAVTEYANCEGDYGLPRDFYDLNDRVCRFIRDTAQRDIAPFAEIGNLVKRHAGIVTRNPDFPRQPDPYATISALHDAIWRSLPAKSACIAILESGASEKPTIKKLKPRGDTVDVIRQLQAGRSPDEILAFGQGKSVDNIRQIRSRWERGEYEI